MLQNQIHLMENLEKEEEIEEQTKELLNNAQMFGEKAKKLKNKNNLKDIVLGWISHLSSE